MNIPMKMRDARKEGAVVRATWRVPRGEEHLLDVRGVDKLEYHYVGDECLVIGITNNAYVNNGLRNSLDREFGIGGDIVNRIAVTDDATTVTADTTKLDPTDDDTVIVKAFDDPASRPAGTQTVTVKGTFTKADGNIVHRKIGLLTTPTDAGTGLVNVIGGTGGVAPYDEAFAWDGTLLSNFTAVYQLDITAEAS